MAQGAVTRIGAWPLAVSPGGAGVGESVAGGGGLDDLAGEGEPVEDGGA